METLCKDTCMEIVWKLCVKILVWKLYGIYICLDYVWIISMEKCMEWYGMEV